MGLYRHDSGTFEGMAKSIHRVSLRIPQDVYEALHRIFESRGGASSRREFGTFVVRFLKETLQLRGGLGMGPFDTRPRYPSLPPGTLPDYGRPEGVTETRRRLEWIGVYSWIEGEMDYRTFRARVPVTKYTPADAPETDSNPAPTHHVVDSPEEFRVLALKALERAEREGHPPYPRDPAEQSETDEAEAGVPASQRVQKAPED